MIVEPPGVVISHDCVDCKQLTMDEKISLHRKAKSDAVLVLLNRLSRKAGAADVEYLIRVLSRPSVGMDDF